ncbi:MAG: hypothetical protein M1812_003678 [Candelaria pacifica]|nr:MAG: hypothetical protein M1812_003678 [Candelaria pacifica]
MAPGRPSKDTDPYSDIFGALDEMPSPDLTLQHLHDRWPPKRPTAKRPARKPTSGPPITAYHYPSYPEEVNEVDAFPFSGNLGLPATPQISASQRSSRPTKRAGSRLPVHGASGLEASYPSTRQNGRASDEPSFSSNVQPVEVQPRSSREGAQFAKWLQELPHYYQDHDPRGRKLFIAACQYWYGLEDDDAKYIHAGEPPLDDIEAILKADAIYTSSDIPGDTWSPIDGIDRRHPGTVTLWHRKAKFSESTDYLACKTISNQPNFFKDYVVEARLVRRLNFVGCENVPKVFDWKAIGRDRTRIIYEYCQHGGLNHMIQFYQNNRLFVPEAFIWHVFHSLVKVICYCETGSLGGGRRAGWDTIVHLDMKPTNIFLGDPVASDNALYPAIKFVDFEGAYTIPNDPDQAEGVQRYQSGKYWPSLNAPLGHHLPSPQENGGPYSTNGTHDPDFIRHSGIYGLGRIMHDLLLAGLSCYDAQSRSVLIGAYNNGDRQIWNQYNYKYTDELTTLIRHCIHAHENTSFTTQDLLKATGIYNEEFKTKLYTTPQSRNGVYDGMALYSQEQRRLYVSNSSFASSLHSHFRYQPINDLRNSSGNAVQGTLPHGLNSTSSLSRGPEPSEEEFPIRGFAEKALPPLPSIESSEEEFPTRGVSRNVLSPTPSIQISTDDLSERGWREKAPSPSQSPESPQSHVSGQSSGSPIAPYAGGLLNFGVKPRPSNRSGASKSPGSVSGRLPPEPISPTSWQNHPDLSHSRQNTPEQLTRPTIEASSRDRRSPSAEQPENVSLLKRQRRGGITKPSRPSAGRPSQAGTATRPPQRAPPTNSTRLPRSQTSQPPHANRQGSLSNRNTPSAGETISVAQPANQDRGETTRNQNRAPRRQPSRRVSPLKPLEDWFNTMNSQEEGPISPLTPQQQILATQTHRQGSRRYNLRPISRESTGPTYSAFPRGSSPNAQEIAATQHYNERRNGTRVQTRSTSRDQPGSRSQGVRRVETQPEPRVLGTSMGGRRRETEPESRSRSLGKRLGGIFKKRR